MDAQYSVETISEQYTHCGECGTCQLAVMSPEVMRLRLQKMQAGVYWTMAVVRQCLKYGEVQCSLEHSSVSCAGRVKLGLVGLTDDVVSQVLRDFAGDEYDASDEEEFRQNEVAEVPREERHTIVSVEELFVRLFEGWNEHRLEQPMIGFRQKLDSASVDILKRVREGTLGVQQVLSLRTTDRW
jgi:hypothetical protein